MKIPAIRRWLLVPALLGSALLGVNSAAQDAAPSPGPRLGDPLLDAAAAKYSAAQWPKGERRDGFVLEDLSLTNLVGGDVEHKGTHVARVYKDAGKIARVLVEVTVGDSVADGHLALVRHLASFQSTKTLQAAQSRGIQAGDHGYVAFGGRDSSKLAWIAFVVGNVEFRLVNLDPDASGAVDLKPLVELVSARALAQPALAAGEAVHKPAITAFSADRSALAAGDSALLDLVATDPTGRPALFDFEVGGAKEGEGYVEQDDTGRWRFHATGEGRTTLTVLVLGRNGTSATRSITLEISK